MLRLLDLPHRDAERALATGAPVFLPVNPVEYHGPHLSLHNDRLISLALSKGLHARLVARHPTWPLLLAEDVEIGVEPCPGPGTRHTPYGTAVRVIRETCRALAELGARRVVFMTFHGSPLHAGALEEGIDELAKHGVPGYSPFNIVVRNLVEPGDLELYSEAVASVPAAERQAVLRELPLDFHAGFFETSMALWAAPDSVSASHVDLPPCPPIPVDERLELAAIVAAAAGKAQLARDLGFASRGVGWQQLRPFPGYTGRPALASRAAGDVFARAILDLYDAPADDVLFGRVRSPAPIMQWTRHATLDGRIPSAPRPTMGEMLRIP
jgi:creatinine amidohydrolase